MNQIQHTQTTPTGQQMIGGGFIQCEGVGPDDLVAVDFDAREVSVDGFYVVRAIETGAIICRRFERSVIGGLIFDGQPYKGGAEILGQVTKVFTPKSVI